MLFRWRIEDQQRERERERLPVDLDAAVDRARFFHANGNYLRDDTRRMIARNVLELALTATDGTSGEK